jgi:hypothetical protein
VGQARGSLSNRKGTSAKSALSLVGIGVDRLSLSFPVDAAEGDESAWDRFSVVNPGMPAERQMWSASVEAAGGRFFVGVATLPEEAPYRCVGKVEWNPSRVGDPDGWGLATVEEALASVGPAVVAVGQRMRPVWRDPREWNLKRIDVAKDFGEVDEAAQLIRGLGAIHRPWSRLNQTHADPKRHGAQTLMVGSGAGVVRLYDKEAETKGGAPKGTVRWECEARTWAKERGHMKMLGDVGAESVELLGSERFVWSGMGAEVAGSMSRLVAVVHDCEYLSSAQKRSFLGWLVEQAAGVECTIGSAHTLAKYRRLQRELGIAAPCDFGSMLEVVRRLDWDSGREVVNVRAA